MRALFRPQVKVITLAMGWFGFFLLLPTLDEIGEGWAMGASFIGLGIFGTLFLTIKCPKCGEIYCSKPYDGSLRGTNRLYFPNISRECKFCKSRF